MVRILYTVAVGKSVVCRDFHLDAQLHLASRASSGLSRAIDKLPQSLWLVARTTVRGAEDKQCYFTSVMSLTPCLSSSS